MIVVSDKYSESEIEVLQKAFPNLSADDRLQLAQHNMVSYPILDRSSGAMVITNKQLRLDNQFAHDTDGPSVRMGYAPEIKTLFWRYK